MEITNQFVKPGDTELIGQIAAWYLDEWHIPEQNTIDRLTNMPEDGIPFHIVLKVNGVPVCTGGLHHDVGLVRIEPRFAPLGPWVALIYTVPAFRGQGLGAKMCTLVEEHARSLGLTELFLYTATAEKLYARLGWIAGERLIYRELDTVVMWKQLLSED